MKNEKGKNFLPQHSFMLISNAQRHIVACTVLVHQDNMTPMEVKNYGKLSVQMSSSAINWLYDGFH
jgi:hypothetical protein